jgi:hypothetical protein
MEKQEEDYTIYVDAQDLKEPLEQHTHHDLAKEIHELKLKNKRLIKDLEVIQNLKTFWQNAAGGKPWKEEKNV